jgi:hypothetical protein
MILVAFLIAIVLVCALAAAFGADSRPIERGPHRSWL